MKSAPHSRQHHDLYAKYHYQDSEIRDLLGEYGIKPSQPLGSSTVPLESNDFQTRSYLNNYNDLRGGERWLPDPPPPPLSPINLNIINILGVLGANRPHICPHSVAGMCGKLLSRL